MRYIGPTELAEVAMVSDSALIERIERVQEPEEPQTGSVRVMKVMARRFGTREPDQNSQSERENFVSARSAEAEILSSPFHPSVGSGAAVAPLASLYHHTKWVCRARRICDVGRV